MRLDDYRMSDNVEDHRGRGVGFGGGGGLGGGLFGMLFGLVLSRFGIVGVLILLLGYCALSTLGGGSSLGVGGPGTAVAPHQATAGAEGAPQACAVDAESRFSCRVLASTEDTWAKIFAAKGERYQPAGFIFYGGSDRGGCGIAQSAMGPFYCPTDNKVYLDTSFYTELRSRFGAAGDFAQAYVIAHEIGHHVQFLTGTLQRVQQQQQRLSGKQGNALQVLVELQADCYAGVWAAQNRDRMEPGDVEEGLTAASAIGDDTLQRQSQGYVVPESFTHGSAAQRQQWLRTGLTSGDPAACDTFAGRG